MDGHTISDAARRTGFTPSALRFYEDAGLVVPARRPSGYRSYSDADLERLAFVARAKGFGLTLEEIAELLGLLGEERCEPVQERLRELVDAKVVEAEATIAERRAFVDELRRLAAGFDRYTAEGACDDRCGCRTDAPVGGAALPGASTAVVMGRSAPSAPIACRLPSGELSGRVAEWRARLAPGEVTETEHGATVRFPAGTDLAPLAALAAAEQACCTFFTFVLAIDATGATLEISAPGAAAPLVRTLTGAPA
jgi:DNA-binding transcriptional MerR regulator